MKKPWALSYPLSAQWRLWSDWADAQADLSLRWAHTHFVGFVMSWLMCQSSVAPATSWQNQQNDQCARQRFRSALALAQSDQNLCYPHEETFGPYLPIECTAKTLIRLCRCPGWPVFAERTHHFVSFVVPLLISKAIRLSWLFFV